jgi:hypothetical protein
LKGLEAVVFGYHTFFYKSPFLAAATAPLKTFLGRPGLRLLLLLSTCVKVAPVYGQIKIRKICIQYIQNKK